MKNERMYNELIELLTTDSAAGKENAIADKLTEKMEALGFTVPEEGPYLNVPLSRLHLKPNTLIASILRGQRVIIPGGDDCMLAGDSVVVVAEPHRTISNLTDIFSDRGGFVE